MLTTYYTSFLFAPVSYIAWYLGQPAVALLYNMLFGTSILHHAKYFDEYPGKYGVYMVDKCLAHTIVVLTMYIAVSNFVALTYGQLMYWFGLCWITYVFYIAKYSHLPGKAWIPWHASIHIVASIGTVALLTDVRT